MCAQYWSLNTVAECPKCGVVEEMNLQTHFMGGRDGTWCDDYYILGESVEGLYNMTVTLDGYNDSFIASCPKCNGFSNFGASIVNGRVTSVWPLKS